MKNIKHKPLSLIQGSQKWHTWREDGIGASEAGILMGSLPFSYDTVLELWKKKTGIGETIPFKTNEAVEQGRRLEPVALAKYCEIVGEDFTPKCFSHPKYKFIRASLDGINASNTKAVEIKCPGITKFKEACKGKVVDYYYSQIQAQMLCSNIQESLDYWVYREQEGGVLLRVYRNEPYIDELIRRSELFWQMVEAKEPALPRHFGFDMSKPSQPYIAGDMRTELVKIYKN